MNILIEGGDLNPPFAEGTRNIALTHARGLVNRGHRVIILTRKKDRIFNKVHPDFEIVDGIRFYRWSNYFNLLKKYKQIIKAEKVDLVHMFVKGARPSIYLRMVKSLAKVPIVYSLLGFPGKRYASLKIPDAVVITSRHLHKTLGLKNSIYMPYCFDYHQFNNYKNRNLKKILCLRYMPESLIQAIKITDGKVRGVKYLLNEHTLNRNPTIKKGSNVQVLPRLNSSKELFNNYLRNAGILIDLHPNETLLCASPPLLILEAMASGVTVISSNIPEIKEIIRDGKTGFITENEPNKIYHNIVRAMKPNTKIKENARNIVINLFGVEQLIPKYEKLYKRLR